MRGLLPGLGLLALLALCVGAAQAEMTASGPAGTITLSSPSEDGGVTNTNTVVIEGVLADASARLTVDGASWAVDAAGHFRLTYALVEGMNVFGVAAENGAGDRTQLAFAVTRDTVVPALQVFAPVERTVLSDDRTTVFGQTELGASVMVNGRAAEVNIFDGTFTLMEFTLAPTSTGCFQPATVTVSARDRAGNLATVTRSVTADHCVTHPTLSVPIPELTVVGGQSTSLALDLSSYFADDGGAGALSFLVTTVGRGANALSVTYSPGALALHWADAGFTGAVGLRVQAQDREGELSDPTEVPIMVVASPTTNEAPRVRVQPGTDPLPVGGVITIAVAVTDPEGDPVEVTAEAAGAGLRVLSVDPAGIGRYTVRVTADATALEAGALRIVITATDAHFASASDFAALEVYDPGVPAGFTLVDPAVAEFIGTQFSEGPAGMSGVTLGIASARRVPHLFLADPALNPNAEEVVALNEEQTYWSVFFALPTAPGVYTRTVWVQDPGLPARPTTFAITVLPTPAPPQIDRIVPVTGALSFDAGEPVSLRWLGTVADVEDTAFEWRVDGEVVSRDAGLDGVVLDAGSHAVTVTATTPQGSSSASATVSVASRAGPALPARSTPWALWIGLSGLLIVGLILGGTEVGLYFLVAGALGAIIDRENREKLLAHFVRGRIYQIIEYEPGIHLSELQRKAGAARGVCAYHLHALEKAGLVKTMRDGMFLRFYATKVKIDADAYALAADDRAILHAIEERPGISEREVAELLGRSSGQVARAVKALAQSGHVEARREGEAVLLYPRTQRGSAAAPAGHP